MQAGAALPFPFRLIPLPFERVLMITVLWYSGAIALTSRESEDANGSRLEK
jgi:hypothetical protein